MSDKKPKLTRAILADLLYNWQTDVPDGGKLSRPQSERIVRLLIESIQFALWDNRKIEFRGLGTFGIKDIPAGKAWNSKAGKFIEYEKSKTVFFRPSETLKKQVNKQHPVESEEEKTNKENKE